MANIKKFKNPVHVQIRMEKELKKEIIQKFGNITDFLNKVAKKEIESSK